MEFLYDKLVKYSKTNDYPMHMPGHKRNTMLLPMANPYSIDITEIEGFDNLHQAEGILKELGDRIASLYKAAVSYPLINGSTTGLLAGISSAVNRGDKIIMARNSHKSVYHAVIINQLNPVYIYPEYREGIEISGGILPDKLERLLIKNPDTKLVVITSPTYEGVVSDIEELAKVSHRHKALLLVDEAHGAHFGFHRGFPESALSKGADLVVQSFHKTLPAFTQTAVLHSNKKELDKRLVKYLGIYQSSSPSYLLLAGIDRCIRMLEEKAEEYFEAYYNKLQKFYQEMGRLTNIMLLNSSIIGKHGIYNFDSSKITILGRNNPVNGHQLNKILKNKYHITMEMESLHYVLGMTSIFDTKEGFERLGNALLEIDSDSKLCQKNDTGDLHGLSEDKRYSPLTNQPEQIMLPCIEEEEQSVQVKLKDSIGRISGAFVSCFPPGIPIIVPGEKINKELVDYIETMRNSGIMVTGLSGKNKDGIEVIIAV